MGESNGPSVTIKLSCIGCIHRKLERDDFPNDPGWDRVCTHNGSRRDLGIGDHMPNWCPLMPSRWQLLEDAQRSASNLMDTLEDRPAKYDGTRSCASCGEILTEDDREGSCCMFCDDFSGGEGRTRHARDPRIPLQRQGLGKRPAQHHLRAVMS